MIWILIGVCVIISALLYTNARSAKKVSPIRKKRIRRPRVEPESPGYMDFFVPDSPVGQLEMDMLARLAAKNPPCEYAPNGHYYRQLYDKLYRFGLLSKGEAIPVKHVLAVLPESEVQAVAERLGAGRARTKKDLIDKSLAYPEKAIREVLLSLQTDINDIFYALQKN